MAVGWTWAFPTSIASLTTIIMYLRKESVYFKAWPAIVSRKYLAVVRSAQALFPKRLRYANQKDLQLFKSTARTCDQAVAAAVLRATCSWRAFLY